MIKAAITSAPPVLAFARKIRPKPIPETTPATIADNIGLLCSGVYGVKNDVKSMKNEYRPVPNIVLKNIVFQKMIGNI